MDIEIKKIETDIVQIENEIKQSQLKLNRLKDQKDSLILIKSLQDDFIICIECHNSDYDSEDG